MIFYNNNVPSFIDTVKIPLLSPFVSLSKVWRYKAEVKVVNSFFLLLFCCEKVLFINIAWRDDVLVQKKVVTMVCSSHAGNAKTASCHFSCKIDCNLNRYCKKNTNTIKKIAYQMSWIMYVYKTFRYPLMHIHIYIRTFAHMPKNNK